VRRADIVALHARFYRPDNAALIFAGDIDPKDAVALAQAAFGRWARPAAALPVTPVNAAQPVARSPLAIAMAGAGQAGVAMAMPSIARAAPDYYAGQVANTILGSGYSSRLSQEIRIKRGLSACRADSRHAGRRHVLGVDADRNARTRSSDRDAGRSHGMGAAPPGLTSSRASSR
jgi:predicted Zn-dependent peptidase